jgi:hypothetical protein
MRTFSFVVTLASVATSLAASLAPSIALAEVVCSGGLSAKGRDKFTQLTPVDPVSKQLSGYAARGDVGGFTFRADIKGKEVVLKIIPDDSKPILKKRVVIGHGSDISVKVSPQVSAYITCSEE